jgi:hypothetical protein
MTDRQLIIKTCIRSALFGAVSAIVTLSVAHAIASALY